MTIDGGDQRSTGSFLRGLTLGALLGAAVAGSSLWSRRRRRAHRHAVSSTAPSADPSWPTGATPAEPDAPDDTHPATPDMTAISNGR